MLKRGIIIKSHQGLGDHVLCIGIYKQLAGKFSHCILPVRGQYLKSLQSMLRDVSNIEVLSYDTKSKQEPWENWYFYLESHEKFLSCLGYESLNLGSFNSDFLTGGELKFDEEFYRQAELPFDTRWSEGKVCRNLQKERELFDFLQAGSEPYVFLHEDKNRNYLIDRGYLPKDVRVIQPSEELMNRFCISDYMQIIEKATEIHCIESAFCALIETYMLEVPKFAHRYARPEAKGSKQLEFSYKSKWIVLNHPKV